MTNDPNPLAEALENYNAMRDALAFAEDQVKQTQMMNTDLARENAWLREQYDEVKHERDRLQAYAVDLTTRLDVVVEIAQTAKAEARKFAIRPLVPSPEPLDDPDLAELVQRLPANDRKD